MKPSLKFGSEYSYIRHLFGWIGSIALVTGLSMFYIWHQVQSRELMREIMSLKHQKETVEKENIYLQVRLVRLHEKHRVATLPTNRFNLNQIAVGQVVRMDSEDIGLASVKTEPDIRAVAGINPDRSLILASYPLSQLSKR